MKGLYAAQDPDGSSGTSSETSPSPDDIAEEARKGEVQRIASNNPAETRARTAWYGQLHANADGNPADNLAEEAKKGEYINKLYG